MARMRCVGWMIVSLASMHLIRDHDHFVNQTIAAGFRLKNPKEPIDPDQRDKNLDSRCASAVSHFETDMAVVTEIGETVHLFARRETPS